MEPVRKNFRRTPSLGLRLLGRPRGLLTAPFLTHLSIATAASVFIVPVVAGVIIGGFPSGAVSVGGGFLVYDFLFIPPTTGSPSAAAPRLGGARGVRGGHAAGGPGRRQPRVQRSRRSAGPGSTAALRAVRAVGGRPIRRGVARDHRPGGGHLVRSTPGWPCWCRLPIVGDRRLGGERLSRDQLRHLDPHSGVPVSLGTGPGAPDQVRTVALTAAGRPVGILAMLGTPASAGTGLCSAPSPICRVGAGTSPAAEQAVRSELLVEVDRCGTCPWVPCRTTCAPRSPR